MMVGSLEVDIQDVQNSIDNRDVIDDFDDDNDERTTYNFHKMEVCCCFYLDKIIYNSQFWIEICQKRLGTEEKS